MILNNSPTVMAEGVVSTALRILIGGVDHYDSRPLYEATVPKAREPHPARATLFRLSTDFPLVIEIVNLPERIQAFLPLRRAMIDGGLTPLEKAQVVRYESHNDGMRV